MQPELLQTGIPVTSITNGKEVPRTSDAERHIRDACACAGDSDGTEASVQGIIKHSD